MSEASPSLKWEAAHRVTKRSHPRLHEQPFPNLHRDQQQEESGCPRKPDPTESDSRPSLGNRVGARELFMGEDPMV